MRGDSFFSAIYVLVAALTLHASPDVSVGQEPQLRQALGESDRGTRIDRESSQIQKWFAF